MTSSLHSDHWQLADFSSFMRGVVLFIVLSVFGSHFRFWISQISGATFQISDFTFHISGATFQISDFTFHISGATFQSSDLTFHISHFGYHISDFRFRISDFTFRVPHFRFQISDFTSNRKLAKTHVADRSEMKAELKLLLYKHLRKKIFTKLQQSFTYY